MASGTQAFTFRRLVHGAAFLGAAALVLLPALARAADIVVVHSYHKAYRWDQAWRKGVETVLSDHDLTHVYLDSKRLAESAVRKRAERVWRTFQKRHFDGVILGDDNALRLLGPKIANVSSVPVVFLGINANPSRYFQGANIPATVTGVLERPQLGLNIRLIQSLLPEADKILILMDEGITGDAVYASVQNMRQAMGSMSIAAHQLRKFATWKRHVRNAAANGFDLIVPALFSRQHGPDGQVVAMDKVIRWTHDNTPVPMVGFWRFAIGPDKAMAGVVLPAEKMGRKGASMLQRMFRTGKTPPPKVLHGGRLVVSRSGLQRWGLILQQPMRARAELLP